MWTVLLSYSLMIFGVTSRDVTVSRLVNTAQGPVRGYKDPNENIFAFYNIPYATPPTGPKKFKAPLSPPLRTTILEAIDQEIVCPQFKGFVHGFSVENKTIQEDCLIANIYVPNTDKTNIPVVVYVHGGAFVVGYGNMLTPIKIVDSKKIIAVTFNYRLGAHGFLCLGTSDIPGNAGMKDQVALLRWVQENIENFGGNPRDVTIAGYSAGSSSVELLMISKMAKGLFTKIIAESGDLTSPYTVQVNPIQNSKTYAKLLNFENADNTTALEYFYKNISYDLLQSLNTLHRPDSNYLISPCVESNIGQDIFLDTSPLSILNSGDFTNLPVLTGFANMEGLFHIDVFEQFKDAMNANFSNFIPTDLGFSSQKEKEKVATKIKKFYFGDQLVSTDTILKYVDYFTDTMFACPILRTVKKLLAAGNNNVYLFEYSVVDEASSLPVPYTDIYGAQHCAETFAVLDGVNFTNNDVNEENNISNKLRHWKNTMREAWSNFIINGEPASNKLPDWRPDTKDCEIFMDLEECPELGVSPNKKACSFWEDLYNTYYHYPIAPISV